MGKFPRVQRFADRLLEKQRTNLSPDAAIS